MAEQGRSRYAAARQWATDHRHQQPDDRMLDVVDRAARVAALREMADRVDRGPTFPLPPSVISALIRERAADIEAGADG